MDTLYIVMPAYNEEINIRDVIEHWYKILDDKSEDSRLVIADSGSNDKTHEILENLRTTQYPKLEILTTTNQYHGPKVIALYDHAIKNRADYIFQTDSDGQTNPDEFHAFWDKRTEYSAILGNRIERGDGRSRAFVEKVVCKLIKIFFSVTVPDANAPFRLMKADVVKKYLYKMPNDYNLPNIMMTVFFVKYGETVKFEKISFKPRQGGINSINIPRIIKIGWNALSDFRSFRQDMD